MRRAHHRELHAARTRPSGVRGERGQALVEFALVLPLVALLLFGVIDFGRAFSYWINQTQLAGEAARWMVVNKNPGAPTPFQDYVIERGTTQELRDGLDITVCYPEGSNLTGNSVRVVAAAPFTFLPIVAGGVTVTLTATATMRLETQPDPAVFGDDSADVKICP